MYTAFVLNDEQRDLLKAILPPKFPDFIGHHITHEFGTNVITGFSEPATIEVYAFIRDEARGVELFLASVNNTMTRPGGGHYHITWSIDRGKGAKPVMSNDAIRDVTHPTDDSTARMEFLPARITFRKKVELQICK